jgi:hypothetical protein
MQSKIRQEFDQVELQRWFGYCYQCWICGLNSWNTFHHICGDHSNSLLNAAPLHNWTCHIDIHPKLKKTENIQMLLEKTLSFLLSNGYVLNDNDKQFIKDHKQIYQDILKNKQ